MPAMSPRPAAGPWLATALLLLGVVTFLAHASLHRHWLIDDAGISLAYARNLAAGHGLVAQPGAAPVEGFSNPLWVLLLAGLYAAGAMALPGSVKLLSLGLTALAFLLLHRALAELRPEDADVLAAGSLLLSAMNPSVVLWCLAGLENPLYLAGIMALLVASLRARRRPGPGPQAVAGLLAAGLAWTRPEGVAWVLLPPVLWTLERRRPPPRLGVYLLAAGLPCLVGILARLRTFGAWVPNTYWVKGGPGAGDLLGLVLLQPATLEKAFQVTQRWLGAGFSHLWLLVGAALAWRHRHRLGAPMAYLAAFLAAAMGIFLLLPGDWMVETRFATPVYPLASAVLLAALAGALHRTPEALRQRRLGLATLVLAAGYLPEAYFRGMQVAGRPNVGIDFTARAHGERFNRAAARLGLHDASLLVADLGGTLLTSRLRVVDLAGLCDRRIARTLGRDPPALRDYLLAEVRPTFMVLQGPWAAQAALESDPRFARDYAALYAYRPGDDLYVAGHASGVYLRREAAAGAPGVAEELRREDQRLGAFLRDLDRGPLWPWLKALPLPRPPPERLRYPSLAGDLEPTPPPAGAP